MKKETNEFNIGDAVRYYEEGFEVTFTIEVMERSDENGKVYYSHHNLEHGYTEDELRRVY